MEAISNIQFQTIDLAALAKTIHAGEAGTAYWQTIQFGGLRIRLVAYSAGYLADHWCSTGHMVYCLEGSFETELKTGESFRLKKGMGYIVSDEMSMHRSSTQQGVQLFILDGDFLSRKNNTT